MNEVIYLACTIQVEIKTYHNICIDVVATQRRAVHLQQA